MKKKKVGQDNREEELSFEELEEIRTSLISEESPEDSVPIGARRFIEPDLIDAPTRADMTELEKLRIRDSINASLEIGLGEEVAAKAKDLEFQIKRLLKSDRLEEARALLLDNVHYALDAARKFIPAQADSELQLQQSLYWDKPSVIIYDSSREIFSLKEKLGKKRWKKEEELLIARHPKRVDRLWAETRPLIENRYHRFFRHREDLAVMFGIARNRKGLLKDVASLEGVFSKFGRLKGFESEQVDDTRKEGEYTSGWDEAAQLWRDYEVYPAVSQLARSLIGLLRDTVRPVKVIRDSGFSESRGDGMEEIEDNTNLLDTSTHRVEIGDRFEFTPNGFLDVNGLLSYFPRYGRGEISFAEAMELIYPSYSEAAGVKKDKFRMRGDSWSMPKSIRKLAISRLHDSYKDPSKDPEAKQVWDWFSKVMLDRWKSTAVDHESLFRYHVPERFDRELFSFYLSMKRNKDLDRNEEELGGGKFRLPELLSELVGKGLIAEGDIDPPLKQRYLKPDEVLTRSSALLGGGTRLEDLVSGKMNKAEAISSGDSPLPILHSGNKLQLRDNFEALAKVMDPGKKHRVLYRGNGVLFIEKESRYSEESRRVGDIYRVIKLVAGANPADGAKICVDGQDYHIKERRSLRNLRRAEEASVDSDSNFLAPRGFVVITDVPTKVFKEKYYKDFMAHVLIQRSRQDGDSLKPDLDALDDFVKRTDPYTVDYWLGEFIPRTRLTTFEVDGNFGFALRHKREADAEVFEAARNIYEFFEENGVGLYLEPEIDESGRESAREKLEDRVFSKRHKEEIVTALHGQGLVKLLSFALMDSRKEEGQYRVSDFGARSCPNCHGNFIDGSVYRPKVGEQAYSGVHGRDLHALAEHPTTFVHKFGNLQRIHHLMMDVQDYVPEFISHPEILPDLYEFIEAYTKKANAESKAMDFWQSTCGGGLRGRYEAEEIEEDPELRALIAEERKLNDTERRLSGRCYDAAERLQARYEQIIGVPPDPNPNIVRTFNFWANQMMVYEIYQTCAPKLLMASSDSPYRPIKIGLTAH